MPLVDYEAVADRYEGGRALAHGPLAAWGRAATGRTPVPPEARVLDLGAGTGIFSRAWLGWGAGLVVAVEPAAAMRAEAVARDPAGVAHLAGRAEALPLVDASVDVAWLSTVLHHIDDLPAAVRELARVVAPGGAVHLRGFFPGHSRTWLQRYLPDAGDTRLAGRFPSVGAAVSAFEAGGFRPVGALQVGEEHCATAAGAADWVERMRGADSLLGLFTDEELDGVVAELRRRPGEAIPATELTLVTLVAGR